jgi:hypothetical protein
MKGRFPDILNSPVAGETARKLYDDAQEMLDTLIKAKWLTANGVIAFFPANAVGSGFGEDVEVYTDESRTQVLTRLHNLRQQGEHRHGMAGQEVGRVGRQCAGRAAGATRAGKASGLDQGGVCHPHPVVDVVAAGLGVAQEELAASAAGGQIRAVVRVERRGDGRGGGIGAGALWVVLLPGRLVCRARR